MKTPVDFLCAFAVSLLLALYCSHLGDDDSIYAWMGKRKPTPKEGIARIRWVLIKGAALFFGACSLTLGTGYLLRLNFPDVRLSKDQGVFLILAYMPVMNQIVGTLQNVIRRSQGRQPHPVWDWAVWKYSISRWLGRR